MDYLQLQLRLIVRRLSRAPAFTVITILTVAIAIGANSAVFSVINGVLLKPLPYPEPERLVAVWQAAPGLNIKDLNLSPSNYFVFRDENRTYESFGIWGSGTSTVTGAGDPEQVPSLNVTDGVLQALSVQPAIGRWFGPAETAPGAPQTVILTYSYWQKKFGGLSSAIGNQLVVGGTPREIIGVMPQSFRFLDLSPDLILPFQFDKSRTFLGQYSYQGVARLKPNVTIDNANADLARMIPLVVANFPAPAGFNPKMFEEARIAPNIRPLKEDVVGDIGKVLWILMGTVGLVLLIACANVANLLLVRAEGRQLELTVRSALGAGRAEIARELLFESLLLALAGGALGISIAYGELRLLANLAPSGLPRLHDISIDPAVLLFALTVSLVSGALFGMIPVFKFAGSHPAAGMRVTSRTLTAGRERHRARQVLVVVQVALAIVLLISSGLMIRTFRALREVQPGFVRPNEIQTARITIPAAQVEEPERVMRMQNEMLDKIAAIPGVSSAAIGNSIPTDGNNWTDPIMAEDRQYEESQLPPLRRFKFVGPGYFNTLGNPILAGRDLAWTDLYEKRRVAIVTENLARELWSSPAAALGKRIRERRTAPWREIVGVVGNVHDSGADQRAPEMVYWPLMMDDFADNPVNVSRTVVFVIRTSRAGTESLLHEVRAAIWAVNSNVPVASVPTLEAVYSRSMARTSFTLVMLAIAGAMALLLGVVGIYGVMSYTVSQRRREIGIRVALGAKNRELQVMFLRHGLLMAGTGAAIGLIAAAALTRLMSSLLFDVQAIDTTTYVTVAIGLTLAAVLATYIPARRALRVNPVEALRSE